MKHAITSVLVLFLTIACVGQTLPQPKPLPITPAPTAETYYGKTVVDDYRNLENMQDSLVQKWYHQQAVYADAILSSISGTDSLMNRMKELNNRQTYYVDKINILENGNYFYLKKEKGEKKYKLFYRSSINGKEILLYDPDSFQIENRNNYTINYIKPSWEGEFVLISLSHSGKELSEMIVIDTAKRIVLPQIISKAWPSSFLGVSWLPDSSGVIYLHFPVTDIENAEFKRNTQSVLYKLGDDPNDFKVLLSSKSNPELNIQPNDYPIVTIKSKHDPYAVAYIASVNNYWDSYFLPIDDFYSHEFSWKSFFSKEDMVYTNTGIFNDGDYFYISALGASNFNISMVSLENLSFKNPIILISEKHDEVIDDFIINAEGLFYSTITNGVEGKLYHFSENVSHKIPLPKSSGKVSLSSLGENSDALWITLSGWISNDSRYLYLNKNKEFRSEELAPIAAYPEFQKFLVKEIEIPSYDGVLVPLSIIYSSDIKMDGTNPTLFYGYGAYGEAINPFFSPLFLTWVENGGILCVPHVRGGGEKGEAWHKAGYKSTKMNTWKDLIAATEYMIDKEYTSKNNTVVYSNSAGGIMVGRAITEKPEVFAASIVDVGVLNPLRRESFSGSSNYKEYGTITDSTEFNGLLAMDPYMHLEKDVNYPAGLYITGMNDPRIPPWMTGKFVAKIQAYTNSQNPILYKVEDHAGHSTSASSDDLYKKWAEMFAFGLWQAGHPDFKLKF